MWDSCVSKCHGKHNGETEGGKNWHFFLDLQTAMPGVWANTLEFTGIFN